MKVTCSVTGVAMAAPEARAGRAVPGAHGRFGGPRGCLAAAPDPPLAIAGLIESRALRPIVDRSFPLEAAADAHRYAATGANAGAVVISIAPPTAP